MGRVAKRQANIAAMNKLERGYKTKSKQKDINMITSRNAKKVDEKRLRKISIV